MNPLRLLMNKEKPMTLNRDLECRNQTKQLEIREIKVKQTTQTQDFQFPLKAIDKLLTHVSMKCLQELRLPPDVPDADHEHWRHQIGWSQKTVD